MSEFSTSQKDPRKIIIVEDEPVSLKLLTRHLEKAGYVVDPYVNGKVAADAIMALRSGIVVADWNMPEMDGLQLLKFVRGMQEMSALGSIYYILLTANDDKEALVTGLDAGADDFLAKPYAKAELLARIRAGERILNLSDEIMARQTQLAKANLELENVRRSLQNMANLDSLTGIPNRRAFFDRFQDMMSVSTRHDRPLTCLMLDVDKFKSVNDTYGHHAGDCVLKQVAHAIKTGLRRHDFCGRLGGEEFAVLCPETPLDGALQLAERLRGKIESMETNIGEKLLRVTASFGVTGLIADDHAPDVMLGRADAMLYRAKESGRNQVWSMDEVGRAAKYPCAVPAKV
ncbi:MAG: diguanylate cyclase [Phycisphaerae bacterium]